MNTPQLKAALNTLSMGLAELAEALEGGEPTGPVLVAPVALPEPLVLHPAAVKPEGSLSVCPKHKISFENGKFGPYCKQFTDEPAWGKKAREGDAYFCTINPRNVHEWLAAHA